MKTQKKTAVKGAMLLWMAAFCMLATACGKKQEEEAPPSYEMVAYQEDQLQDHTYYVKTNSGFYPVAPGILTVEEQDQLIPEKVSNSRIVWFGPDDQQIPTLYKDQSLVYVTSDLIPERFVFERFEDMGYTIGIKGLTQNSGGKYETVLDNFTIHPLSSALTQLTGMETGTVVGIDKIGTTPITSDYVSRGGTILGLTKGTVYNVDMYKGSDYLEDLKIEADTHAFVSFELFETSAYDYKQSIFVTIKIPDYLVSGYYYINGCGLFRYVANSAEKGVNGINFNTPYYVAIDEQGNLLTKEEYDALKAKEAREKGLVTDGSDGGEGGDTEDPATSPNVWSFVQSIDNSMDEISFMITYQDEKKMEDSEYISAQLEQTQGYEKVETVEKDPPRAKLTSPTGEIYTFTAGSSESGTMLSCNVTMPISGEWKVDITGMEDRTFTLTSNIGTGHTNSVMHSGNGTAEMNYYLENALADAQFEVTWENAEHAANIEVITPTKVRRTANENDKDCYKILETDYGKQVLGLDTCIAGYYKIRVSGEELGRVRCVVSEKDKKYSEGKEEQTDEEKTDEEKKDEEEKTDEKKEEN